MTRKRPQLTSLGAMPTSLKRALLKALLEDEHNPDGPVDETANMLVQVLEEHGDPRRAATAEEAQVLVDLAGPCRFKPGDLVKWNPAMHEAGYVFPKLDEVIVVTQVFEPPMHDMSEPQSNNVAVRNDFAAAYINDGEGIVREYTFDSRRFVLASE